MIKAFKEDRNNSFEEIQGNTGKQVEVLKEESNKFHKEIKKPQNELFKTGVSGKMCMPGAQKNYSGSLSTAAKES